MMKTRSQTKRVTYSVDIDFDEASNAWNSNKIKLTDGMYKYKKPKNMPCREPIKVYPWNCVQMDKIQQETHKINSYNLRSKTI